MGWNHVVIEALCFGGEDVNGKYPCGERHTSDTCLLAGHCPHFAWAHSDEREASLFVPLWMILKDKALSFLEEAWQKISWHLWERWFYDPHWIDQYPAVKCPEIDQMEEANAIKFLEWQKRMKESD